MKALVSIACAFCLLFGAACSGGGGGGDTAATAGAYTPAPAGSPEKVAFAHQPGGLGISITAEMDANLVDNEPHAVRLCILQTSDREALSNLAASADGLTELLQCKAKPPLIVSASVYYVQPGEERFISADSSAGANHVAVVAGFDELNPENCFAILPKSIHQESERSGFMWLNKEYFYSAAPMDIEITLGQTSLVLKGAERGR